MEWREFEHEVKLLVEAFGYVAETTRPSHDYGVDVGAYTRRVTDRRRLVVQCKLYGKGRIGGDVMMKLLGTRDYCDATDAMCITTWFYTKQAREIATKKVITLVDREMLVALRRERALTIPSSTVLVLPDGTVVDALTECVTVGRELANILHLASPRVSRRHAVLRRQALQLHVEDLRSSNGTFVNGARIDRATPLSYGDHVAFDSLTCTIALRTPTGEICVLT